MVSFWRKPYMAAVYGFGIALVLTVAGGWVVGWPPAPAAAPSSELAQANSAKASAEKRATDAEAEVTRLRQSATVSASPEPNPNAGNSANALPGMLVVQVETQPALPQLQPKDIAAMAVSYNFGSQARDKGLLLDGNGRWSIARPVAPGKVINVCLKPPPGWRITPTDTVKLLDGDPDRLGCARNPPEPAAKTDPMKLVVLLEQGE